MLVGEHDQVRALGGDDGREIHRKQGSGGAVRSIQQLIRRHDLERRPTAALDSGLEIGDSADPDDQHPTLRGPLQHSLPGRARKEDADPHAELRAHRELQAWQVRVEGRDADEPSRRADRRRHPSAEHVRRSGGRRVKADEPDRGRHRHSHQPGCVHRPVCARDHHHGQPHHHDPAGRRDKRTTDPGASVQVPQRHPGPRARAGLAVMPHARQPPSCLAVRMTFPVSADRRRATMAVRFPTSVMYVPATSPVRPHSTKTRPPRRLIWQPSPAPSTITLSPTLTVTCWGMPGLSRPGSTATGA